MTFIEQFRANLSGFINNIDKAVVAVTSHYVINYPDMSPLEMAMDLVISEVSTLYRMDIPIPSYTVITPTGETPSKRAVYIRKQLCGNQGYIAAFLRAGENGIRFDDDDAKRKITLELLADYRLQVKNYLNALHDQFDQEFTPSPTTGIPPVGEPSYVKRLEDKLDMIIDILKATHNT